MFILVLWDPTHLKVSCVCELRTADFQVRWSFYWMKKLKYFYIPPFPVYRWPGQRINHSYITVSIILIHLVKPFDVKWHVCIHCCNWCTLVILNCSLWPPQCSISCQVWVLTLLKTCSYHPLCKPHSRKQRLCFLFLYSRHKRAAETDNNFTHVPLCKWSEVDGINQSSVCALSKIDKAKCHMHCCRRVYILQLFSGFIAILLWGCVCVCVCERERERERVAPSYVSLSLILTVPVSGLFRMWILESDLECKRKQKVILLTVNFNERKLYMY